MREPPASQTPPKPPAGRDKAERLAKALRANLARRKAQRRTRGTADDKAEQNEKNEG